mgnify:FL=1
MESKIAKKFIKKNKSGTMEKKSLFLLTENDVNSKTVKKIKITKNSIVIPLTFKTIELLDEQKIGFKLFDELLSPKEYEIIDNQIYEIGRTWYEHDYLKQIFEYNEVNIAKTIECELTSSLLKFGHRICILEKIFSVIKPNIVYVSETTKSISKIPRLFSKNYEFEIKNLYSKSDEKNFSHDNYTLGFDIKGKNVDITLSRKNFYRIKKYYELFWKYCYKLSSKQNKPKIGDEILLLDFNLVTNKSTLDNLSNSEFDMLLANTRRPIIWNSESLKIAKKISFKSVQLDFNKQNSHPKILEIINKLENFSDDNNFFFEKFMINNISFWDIFKNDFIIFCKERFIEILSFIDSLNEVLDKKNIKLLITLDDAQQIGRTATILCKNHDIQTMLLRNTDINIFQDEKRNWKIFALQKIYSDKFAIYGELSKKICLEHKIDSKKLVMTGNPRYDELFRRESKGDKNNILITLSGVASTAWTTFYSISLVLKYEKMFRQVLKSLAKLDKKVTIKVHPTQDSIINVQKITNELLPNATILKNANTYDLISQSDVVISPPSSVITEALILNKPVFLFKFLENDSGIPYEKYNAVVATENENSIDFKINQILFDQGIRNKLEIGRKEFLKYALEYRENSSEQVIKLIRNMTSSDKN